MDGFIESLEHAAMITLLVFVMMVAVDFLSAATKGKFPKIIREGRFGQYIGTSFLGATPGCLGAFMNVSFYLRGIITFGALTAGMIATSGDAAFVMISQFPTTAFLLFGILFLIGVVSAPIIDLIVKKFRIQTSPCCLAVEEHSEHCLDLKHYFGKHIWSHIVKKHLWKVFLWCFGAIFLVHVGLEYFNLESFIQSHMMWVLFIAILFGLIPDSGPQIIIVMLFAKGMIPFSVLLASSIVQDGHGILPLLSHSVKDSVLVKIINLIIALVIGLILYYIGI